MTAYAAVRPLLFALPAETAHSLAETALRAVQATPIERILARRYTVTDARLAVDAFGHRFPNPVGVAAGFDKNARIPRALAALGFGHVEIGGVTATPQPGNPRPRLFRLVEDDAIINRMGFNNHGADRIGDRLARLDPPSVPIGINIGKSKTTPIEDAPRDYAYTYDRLAAHGDFFVVNVSSPNTPGLRELQDRDPLRQILTTLQDAGAEPLLVKLSPDLADPAITDAVTLATDLDLAGIIATNTTTTRPNTLTSTNRDETGGLSGRPIESRATEVVRFVAQRTDLPIIGVGGVFSAADAYRKIKAGATLVQLYTGLIYRGPAIAHAINTGLLERVERDGFESITAAVGADLE